MEHLVVLGYSKYCACYYHALRSLCSLRILIWIRIVFSITETAHNVQNIWISWIVFPTWMFTEVTLLAMTMNVTLHWKTVLGSCTTHPRRGNKPENCILYSKHLWLPEQQSLSPDRCSDSTVLCEVNTPPQTLPNVFARPVTRPPSVRNRSSFRISSRSWLS